MTKMELWAARRSAARRMRGEGATLKAIASVLGVSKQRVAQLMLPLKPRAAYVNWTSEMDALLGVVPDTTLAGQWNICTASILRRRKHLNIKRPRGRPRKEDNGNHE